MVGSKADYMREAAQFLLLLYLKCTTHCRYCCTILLPVPRNTRYWSKNMGIVFLNIGLEWSTLHCTENQEWEYVQSYHKKLWFDYTEKCWS
ncbi:hypothetical protein RO3G_06540 [Rhizopus delemar RA 99-880]|uniref:Uncharacterized protein n=1 Tax=Rhizopus delemar (strain RA 99-880 / ATCC MYA-4621 / FGSC 9543 / NRRL 43880) TaxID=246409 RepID=I1C055_RHIO9|nr:hypothetical protein RO3G_06540 [Rhizopus delemar RA 99-880]|eukprot:EIE81835.1 hypothetical protein RO3G_06540 [Rhizopus delemar RA 99-880]